MLSVSLWALIWLFSPILDWSATALSTPFVIMNLGLQALLLNDHHNRGKSWHDPYSDAPFRERIITAFVLSVIITILWLIGVLIPGFSWLTWNTLAAFNTGLAFYVAMNLDKTAEKREEEEFW